MKNKKYAKILVLALSLALLIGAAVGIAASAEGAPEVLKKNIEYGETLKFMVAVDPESVGGTDKTVTLSVYEGDPDNGGKIVGQPAVAEYQDTSETNIGVDAAYIATSTYGVSALAYGQEYYLVVECDGAITKEKYSAVEYFLKRLYNDDIINATDELGIAQKALYQNAISYGSSAQTVAKLENPALDTGTNVADYLYVMAKDGTVNGAKGAVVLKGDALDFAYTGTEDASGLAYWLDPAGTKTTVATASGTYAPRFADFTFNDLSNNTVITQGSSNTSFATVVDGDSTPAKYSSLFFGAKTDYQTLSILDGKLTYTKTTGSGGYFGIRNKNYASANNHTVFETDITIDVTNGTSSTNHTLAFFRGTSNTLVEILMNYHSTSGKLEFKFRRNQIKNSAGTEVATKDSSNTFVSVAEAGAKTATFTLKFESYYMAGDTRNDATMVVSVNDKPVLIGDSRYLEDEYLTTLPTDGTNIGTYIQRADGALCFKYFWKGSASALAPTLGVFYGLRIETYSSIAGTISYDNIIFESDTVATENVPTYSFE